MGTDDVWDQTVAERLRIRELLRGLSPPQWETPSLCRTWAVRDVAAHLISNPQLRPRDALRLVGQMWRGYDEALRLDALRRGSAPIEAILEQWERFATVRRHPFITTKYEPLIDALVHHQDMVRPLGIEVAMPPASVLTVIDRARKLASLMGGAALVRSVRMVATDADWSAGKGPVLRGPIGELLLVSCGRPAARGRLSGAGISQL